MRISSADITGCGTYTFGCLPFGISQWRVSGMPSIRVGSDSIVFSHAAKSTVPGNGVSMTNCAKVTPERSASSAVRSNVCGPIARQPENERAEHMNAVMAERAQPIDQPLAAAC